MLKNMTASAIPNVKIKPAILGTEDTIVSTTLTTGTGTITGHTDGFKDWGATGFVAIYDGTTLKEIIYYASRTNTVLTVLDSAHRNALGTGGVTSFTTGWRLIPVAGTLVGTNVARTFAAEVTIANETTAPSGITFTFPPLAGILIASLPTSNRIGLWLKQIIPGYFGF